MSKISIYHNPRCSKSRQTLALLEENGIEPDIIHYLEQVPDVAELKKLVKKLGVNVRDIIRTGEDAYKELGLKDEKLSDDTLLKAMADNPKLIQRPIVVKGNKAVIGRPPENALDLIG